MRAGTGVVTVTGRSVAVKTATRPTATVRAGDGVGIAALRQPEPGTRGDGVARVGDEVRAGHERDADVLARARRRHHQLAVGLADERGGVGGRGGERSSAVTRPGERAADAHSRARSSISVSPASDVHVSMSVCPSSQSLPPVPSTPSSTSLPKPPNSRSIPRPPISVSPPRPSSTSTPPAVEPVVETVAEQHVVAAAAGDVLDVEPDVVALRRRGIAVVGNAVERDDHPRGPPGVGDVVDAGAAVVLVGPVDLPGRERIGAVGAPQAVVAETAVDHVRRRAAEDAVVEPRAGDVLDRRADVVALVQHAVIGGAVERDRDPAGLPA